MALTRNFNYIETISIVNTACYHAICNDQSFVSSVFRNKKEAKSYFEITESLGVDNPSDILSVTDVYQEATAAKAAGKHFARFSIHTILPFLYAATPLGESYLNGSQLRLECISLISRDEKTCPDRRTIS